jgi:2-polyprenyl-6-methoxyphenol hydroxylase-like FAD-dependent oxidoreductase
VATSSRSPSCAWLRRYERWRKSENLIALGMVDGLNRLFSNPNGTLGWIRRTGLGAVTAARWPSDSSWAGRWDERRAAAIASGKTRLLV